MEGSIFNDETADVVADAGMMALWRERGSWENRSVGLPGITQQVLCWKAHEASHIYQALMG